MGSNSHIFVLHRKHASKRIEYWLVSPDSSPYRTFFLARSGATGGGDFTGKGRGKGLPVVGSWSRKWTSAKSIPLPSDFMEHRARNHSKEWVDHRTSDSPPFLAQLMTTGDHLT